MEMCAWSFQTHLAILDRLGRYENSLQEPLNSRSKWTYWTNSADNDCCVSAIEDGAAGFQVSWRIELDEAVR
jgi:hypothetical protein